MVIDVYSNNKSIRPFTSWKDKSDMYNYLEENKTLKVICDKIRETGDKSLKNQLPAIMPMGCVGDLTRKKENCTPTGLVMVDIDGKNLLSPDVMTDWARGIEPELKRLHVLLVHITPSGRGLRLIAHCHADGMEATVERISKDLRLDEIGETDPACKDLSRLSYLVCSEYIIYVGDLFGEVPAVSIEAMSKYKWTGTVDKNSNVHAKVGDIESSDKENADFEYNGIKVARIVREYIEATGGDPVEGQRHTTYNNLIVQFRNLCNNNPKILHAVLPTFGNSIEETYAQCVSLCSTNRTTRIEKNLYFFLKDKGYLIERVSPIADDAVEQEEEKLPPIPKLPPIFRQYVNAAPDDFKIPTIVALMPILGTLTSHLRSTYFDDSEQSTEFISLLFAPPSSGKSFIKRLSVLLQNLKDRDVLANAREEMYAAEERKKGANEKGKEMPKVSVRIVKPLISVPELLTKMRNNRGHHMYIEAEELDTFTKGNKSAGGDKSDLWRITWDNGYYGQYYKSVNTFKGEVQMFMNLLFTCTQDQISRFFKNVEDGLVTRFSVCPIKNQQFAKFQPWKKIPKKEQLQVNNILNRLETKVYKLPLRFDKEDLIDIKDEDFDKVVPWQYEFQPFEHVNLDYIYPCLLDWLEEQRLIAASTLNPAMDTFRRRAAVKGFRLALLCHGLYNQVGKKEQKVITDFVRWFCTIDLHNSLYQFGEQYNEVQNNSHKKSFPHNDIFNKMGKNFTRTDVRIALQRAGLKTPPRQVVHLWRKNGLIENTGKDCYIKIEKK